MSLGGFLFRRVADIAVPGSGEVIGIVERLKPLVPYILGGIAILILAILIWRAPWAESRQKAVDYAHFQPQLDRALHAEQVALASLQGADNALRVQSKSIHDLAATEAAKLAKAQQLIAEAHRLAAQRQTAIAALRASAAKPLSGAPCEPSETTKGLWQ
jgi:hypothetical protein